MTKKLVLATLGAIAVGIPVATFARADVQPIAVQVAPLAVAGPIAKPVAQPAAKLMIVSLESAAKFTAQINPAEIKLEKHVPWSKQKTSWADAPELSFSGADGRTMSFELSFDTTETKADVHGTYVAKLMGFAMQLDPSGAEDKKRPPRVKVQWGGSDLAFEGVIESVAVKYTMFLPDGTPVKATCTVKLTEASALAVKRNK